MKKNIGTVLKVVPIFGVDWLPLRHQVEKGARGKEEFWQLNGLASKFNSS